MGCESNITVRVKMEDVIKHQAVAFADFLHKGSYIMTSHGKWEDEETYSYTTSELYDLWIKEL